MIAITVLEKVVEAAKLGDYFRNRVYNSPVRGPGETSVETVDRVVALAESAARCSVNAHAARVLSAVRAVVEEKQFGTHTLVGALAYDLLCLIDAK